MYPECILYLSAHAPKHTTCFIEHFKFINQHHDDDDDDDNDDNDNDDNDDDDDPVCILTLSGKRTVCGCNVIVTSQWHRSDPSHSAYMYYVSIYICNSMTFKLSEVQLQAGTD